MSETTSAEILQRMLELLPDAGHWCKGRLYTRTAAGEYSSCLMGAYLTAIDAIHMGSWDACSNHEVLQILAGIINAQYSPLDIPSYARIEKFNDSADVTYEDVRRVLEKAIADAA